LLFLLDHDVDAAVAKVLRAAGHQCVRAAEVGLADAEDDDLSVFADEKGAVLLTHDREFSNRRRRNVFGKHVRLACHDFEAAAIVSQHLEEIVEKVTAREAVYVSQ